MSRIFDALSLGGEADKTVDRPKGERVSEQGLQLLPLSQQNGLECAKTLRCELSPERRLVGCYPDHDLGAERFRFLRHRLNQVRQHRPLSKVLVTSSIPQEGKTLVATNMALSLARNSPRVLLLDADIRQPGVNRILGVKSLPGLAELLDSAFEPTTLLRRLDPQGLYYLPAGQANNNPFELLQRPRMRELIDILAPSFDWIIIDSPPLIPFADAHCLATFTDGVLLVVRPGVTPRKALQQGLAALAGVYVAGVVLNGDDDTRNDRYYYYYHPSTPQEGNNHKKPDGEGQK